MSGFSRTRLPTFPADRRRRARRRPVFPHIRIAQTRRKDLDHRSRRRDAVPGRRGNVIAIPGPEGALMIDGGLAANADALLAAVTDRDRHAAASTR